MAEHLTKKSLVRGMAWADEASTEMMKLLQVLATTLDVRQGERLYNAEDPPGGLYHLKTGRLDLHMPDPALSHDLVHCFGPGWWVGDLAAISGQARRFDLIAGRDSRVLQISRAHLLRVCTEFPEMWRCLSIMASENMRLAVDTVASLRIDNPTLRVASCLVRLNQSGPGWSNVIPIGQSELAQLCNISRRRVVSALKELDLLGGTTRHRMRIKVTPEKMMKIASYSPDEA